MWIIVTILIILLIIISICIIGQYLELKEKNSIMFVFDYIKTIGMWMILIFIIYALITELMIINGTYITPLDVYRDKTELKIDGYYKESIFIATDSTVIMKKTKNN